MGNVLRSQTGEEYNNEDHFELIFGNKVIKNYTTPLHNEIIEEIKSALRSKAKEAKKNCRFFSDTVALWCGDMNDEFTDSMFLPDIMAVCDPKEGEIRQDGVHVVPEFVCEVTSASSWGYDLNQKRQVYKGIGVKEYWVVDPEKRYVAIHVLDDPEGSYTAHWEQLDRPVRTRVSDVEIDLRDIFQMN